VSSQLALHRQELSRAQLQARALSQEVECAESAKAAAGKALPPLAITQESLRREIGAVGGLAVDLLGLPGAWQAAGSTRELGLHHTPSHHAASRRVPRAPACHKLPPAIHAAAPRRAPQVSAQADALRKVVAGLRQEVGARTDVLLSSKAASKEVAALFQLGAAELVVLEEQVAALQAEERQRLRTMAAAGDKRDSACR
jgi:hypothetical protein